ncbi:MAG: hypothetical protein R2728_14575 [Chitinophagales bacterium]
MTLIVVYNLTDKRNTLSAYYIEKAKSFQLFGIERIDQLRICIKIIEQIDTDYNLQLSEATYLESQLGLEYYLLPSFKESQEYFKKPIKNTPFLIIVNKFN